MYNMSIFFLSCYVKCYRSGSITSFADWIGRYSKVGGTLDFRWLVCLFCLMLLVVSVNWVVRFGDSL